MPELPAGEGTATHCPYCALQCGVRVRAASTTDGRLHVAGDPAFPVNQGQLCIKGWTATELLHHPARLLHPQVRDRSGQLRRATWDAALDELAGRLAATRGAHGADAVGVFGSGALTNEKAYMLGKFARVALGTANIDYNGRYCMSSAAAAANLAFGLDRGLPFPVADIQQADTLVLWGANPAETMPPLQQWLDRQQARGGRLVVVDPRRTETARRADLHVQLVPGTDLAVAQGLLHVAVTTGLADRAYLEERTVGFDAVHRAALPWSPTRVERVAGVPARVLREVANALAGVPASMLLSGRGPEQQARGVATVLALINLMLVLGKVGRPASGYGSLTGQANGQGGREHGQKADQLPGYRSIGDPVDRAAVAGAWGVPPGSLPGPGASAVDMLHHLGDPGGVRALLVVGSNLAVASPGAARVARRLDRLDCLGVLDSLPNETTARAHVVLPVASWAEEDGTLTNLEGRILRRRAVSPAPPGVRSDLEVLCALAERLGCGEHFTAAAPEDVFTELAAATSGGRADYAGITYRRIDLEPAGVHWPCPGPDHPGTPRLFRERFAHPDGRARLVAAAPVLAGEEPDEEFPYYFTTGRLREHYNTGAQTRAVTRLVEARPGPRLQLHPHLAERLGVGPGDPVLVESRRGAVTFAAAVDAGIRPDTVFAPVHWGGAHAANLLTNPVLDPTSRMPELKVCAVRLAPGGRP